MLYSKIIVITNISYQLHSKLLLYCIIKTIFTVREMFKAIMSEGECKKRVRVWVSVTLLLSRPTNPS